MRGQMKYIILDGHLHDIPVLFPASLEHAEMADDLKHLGEPLSAGFVDLMYDGSGVSAHGRSTSLGISSRPEDSEIIGRFLGQKG